MNRPPSDTRSSNSPASSAAGVISILSLLESLTLAIALALIIRGFVVEAFVIPTGSMAESLLGTHIETVCKNCRYTYTTGLPIDRRTNRPESYVWSKSLVCPNCEFETDKLSTGPIYRRAGDRVLVLKPMYFLSRYKPFRWLAPKRWDVAVFLYPGSGLDNFIKRLTGLPGETIEIIDGDVYIDGRIARKPPRVQQHLWIPVFDNDYQRQWATEAWPRFKADADIDRLHDGRQLRLKAGAAERFITYDGPIDNTLTYNALRPLTADYNVTDLRLALDVAPSDLGSAAQVTAVLSKRDHYFRLRLDLADSASPYLELQHALALPDGSGHSQWRTVQDDAGPLRYELPPPKSGRFWHLALQNVDYQASVWLDGRRVLATTDGSYGPAPLAQLRALAEEPAPKPTVLVSARDCQADFMHIRLDRDVYYTSDGRIGIAPDEHQLADAQAFRLQGQPPHACGRPFRIPSETDSSGLAYFMMGDNSSDSRDSRLWSVKHQGLDDDYVRGTVPQDHMIGQAFFVYWPAAGPLVRRQLPLIPRVGRMRLIR